MKQNETKQIQQLQMNELTMFQQIALEAEVVSIMKDCTSDYEKMYYAFLKLALCEEKYLLVYKHEFMKYLDESDINELIGYRYKEIVPSYLYIKKYLAEIRGMMGEDCGSVRIFKQPIEVVKSKFIVAMRELLTYIPATASAILDGIIREADGDLDFLIPIAFSLKQESEVDAMEQRIGYDVKLKLLSTPIDRAPIMNLQIEDERLQKQLKMEGLTQEERITKVANDLSSMLNTMVKGFSVIENEDDSNEDEKPEKLVYVVKKIDKSNNQVVFTKEFDTQQQATDYVKNVVKDYPEIIKRFNFAVELVEV
jgi:hypothetical protein